MTLSELIKSIHEIEAYLKQFEEKYLLLSEDFYQLAIDNKLEQNHDFIEWLGIYEIKKKREMKYHQLVSSVIAGGGSLVLPLKDSISIQQ